MEAITINSRERVIKALKHQEADRIPLDINGTVTTGIHRIAYKSLLNYLNYNRKVEIMEIGQQLASIDEDILKKLKVDVRSLFGKLPSSWNLEIVDDGNYKKFTDQWGIGWKKPNNKGLYYDPVENPFKDMTNIKEVENYEFPDPQDPARFNGVKQQAIDLKNKSNAAIALAGVSAGFLEMAYWLRGYENLLMDFVNNEKMAEAILDKTVEAKIKYWDKALELFGDKIDIVVEADDFASQRGMIISPRMYRKFIKPRQKKLFDTIKNANKEIFICFHSCGSVYEIIPDLIEVGIDALNPVQVSAANMDSKKLKDEFGDDLTFWGGGIDTQQTLNRGSVSEIKDEVKRRIDDLAPGGGFIFSAVHNIQADVAGKNIMAMWEAWNEYGEY